MVRGRIGVNKRTDPDGQKGEKKKEKTALRLNDQTPAPANFKYAGAKSHETTMLCDGATILNEPEGDRPDGTRLRKAFYAKYHKSKEKNLTAAIQANCTEAEGQR